jgi:glycosyltransferase involved in cell wall biosynthesis
MPWAKDSAGGAPRGTFGRAPVQVIHIGPDPRTVGGMQSVLRTIREHSIGADQITIVPTWDRPSVAHNALLVTRAAQVILSADRRSILHVHLSDRGAYLRDPPLAGLARARGLRVVLSLHGHDFPEFAELHPKLVRSALAPAQHVICLSDRAAAAARRTVASERVSTLPNPVAIDHAAPPASQTEPIVLFAGKVGLRKGVDVLVEAWRALLASGIDGACRIVGPIDDYRPPSLERLTVEGPADPARIRQLIRAARVIALPSRSEQMPMILAESLAAGRPFVATAVGGTRLLAPSPEMLVPVGDAAALAAALGAYLSDPALADTIGTRGQAFCIETRSPEIIDARLRAIYASC